MLDWSGLEIEKELANRQARKKEKADSTKRMGNHSEDEALNLDIALNKNPLNGTPNSSEAKECRCRSLLSNQRTM